MLYSQSYYSYYDGKKIYYKSSENYIIKFNDETVQSQKEKLLIEQAFTKSIKRIESIDRLSILALKDEFIDKNLDMLSYIQNDYDVDYLSPILLNEDDKIVGCFTDEFIVKLKTNKDISILLNLCHKYKVTIDRQYKYDERTYFIRMFSNKEMTSMKLANLFYETGFLNILNRTFCFSQSKELMIHFIINNGQSIISAKMAAKGP
ncbi:MAG: hypothetical protein HC880_00010 [Bacteroidia bacterium]|nr:hypothetical protein [Bacteroidia bacterium]